VKLIHKTFTCDLWEDWVNLTGDEKQEFKSCRTVN